MALAIDYVSGMPGYHEHAPPPLAPCFNREATQLADILTCTELCRARMSGITSAT